MDIKLFIQSFWAFFAIMNPIGNAPIFLALTDGFPKEAVKKSAFKAVLIAFLIVLTFAVSGHLIFKLFSIDIKSFKIAGGILIFFIGFEMIHGRKSKQHHFGQNEHIDLEELEAITISPLATPILAGPGTITTTISLVGSNPSLNRLITVLIAFAVISIFTYISFRFSEKLVDFLGKNVIAVIARLMGLILTVIGVSMVIAGIKL